MGKYFLVDFENVHEDGLVGLKNLGEEDCVDIFYTQNANKISFDIVNVFLSKDFKAKLVFHEVRTGKQSLDFQLTAYLGFLIGKDSEDKNKYYIISKDKGFVHVAEFLDNFCNKTVTYQNNLNVKTPIVVIKEPLVEPESKVIAEEPNTVSKDSKKEFKKSKNTDAKTTVEQEIITIEENAPIVETEPLNQAVEQLKEALAVVYGDVTKETSDSTEENVAVADVPSTENALITQVPMVEKKKPAKKKKTKQQKNANQSVADESAKKVEEKAQKKQPDEKTILNSEIQKTLSKAKFDTTVISKVAQLVASKYKEEHMKKAIYQDIIKEFGQKSGLEIYNNIKNLLEK